MHKKKIAHGDIKLDNIFIGPDNNIRLSDFGESQKYMDEEQLKTKIKEMPNIDEIAEIFEISSDEFVDNEMMKQIHQYNKKITTDIEALGNTILFMVAKEKLFSSGENYIFPHGRETKTNEEKQDYINSYITDDVLKDLLKRTIIDSTVRIDSIENILQHDYFL